MYERSQAWVQSKTYELEILKENEILSAYLDFSWRTLNVLLTKPDDSQWQAYFFYHKENIRV